MVIADRTQTTENYFRTLLAGKSVHHTEPKMNSDGVQFLTFRSQLFEKRETLTRTRGMRNYVLERYSSTLSPAGNIFLITNLNGYSESPSWNELSIYGETEITDQGVEILKKITIDLRWCSNISNPIIFDISASPIDVVIIPIIVKVPEGYILTFCRINTNVQWAVDVLATKAVSGIC